MRSPIRCLQCNRQYEKFPDGGRCASCDGPVSIQAGTIYVGRPALFGRPIIEVDSLEDGDDGDD